MGKIWTPEEPEEPRPQGGIELPKGFSRRREREVPQEPTPATPPPATPGTAPEPQVAAPDQEPDFLFPPAGAQVQCPGCGQAFVTPVFSIIDLGANPELKQALLGGMINVAICPQCGAGGALSAPLMVHEPEHGFLGVYVPPQAQLNSTQAQRVIGEMTQALMNRLPGEARRGYMLQARQFMDWDRFIEKLWGLEGVTPEMLRRRREQGNLMTRLLRLVNDEEALRMVVERSSSLIDQEFFAQVTQTFQIYMAQGQRQLAEEVRKLRRFLLDNTEIGAQIRQEEERIQQFLARLKPRMSRAELLDLVIEAWQEEDGKTIVGLLVSTAMPVIDYQFLMELAQRIDATSGRRKKGRLEALRQFLLEIQEEQRQNGEIVMQQVQALLQEVLQAPDPAAVLRKYAHQIDEFFLNVLAANMQQAQRNNATAAARRLRQVYEQALSIYEERMPENIRLLNQLLRAPDDAASRKLLQENRELLTGEFVEAMGALEEHARNDGNAQLAGRIKSLRGQMALLQ